MGRPNPMDRSCQSQRLACRLMTFARRAHRVCRELDIGEIAICQSQRSAQVCSRRFLSSSRPGWWRRAGRPRRRRRRRRPKLASAHAGSRELCRIRALFAHLDGARRKSKYRGLAAPHHRRILAAGPLRARLRSVADAGKFLASHNRDDEHLRRAHRQRLGMSFWGAPPGSWLMRPIASPRLPPRCRFPRRPGPLSLDSYHPGAIFTRRSWHSFTESANRAPLFKPAAVLRGVPARSKRLKRPMKD